MTKEEYIKIIRETFEEVIGEFNTDADKSEFEDIFKEVAEQLIETQDDDYQTTFESLIANYLGYVEAVSKLSPGLATGIHDEKHNITVNTYSGKVSDEVGAQEIDENIVFDSSSMTKMFTAILLLKEAEKGNIDLSKKFSDYSPMLSNIDVPIMEALKFGTNIRTNGRIDDPTLSSEERMEKLLGATITEQDTFLYSDMPYMYVPLLFGNTPEEATENYIAKFYELFRDELGLEHTGYSTINMTGGPTDTKYDSEENKFVYSTGRIFDPKTQIFETEVGYVSGHSGVTTTVEDLEKLMNALSNGLLSSESLKTMTTSVRPGEPLLLDDEGNPVIRNGKTVPVNRGLGVYINLGNLRISDVAPQCGPEAFAAEGSTGVYAAFDIENGFFTSYLPNAKGSTYAKVIDADNHFGDEDDQLPEYKATVIKGVITRPDGTNMFYVRATNFLKEEGLRTLLGLRTAKLALIKKAEKELSGQELEQALKEIGATFNVNAKANVQSKTK